MNLSFRDCWTNFLRPRVLGKQVGKQVAEGVPTSDRQLVVAPSAQGIEEPPPDSSQQGLPASGMAGTHPKCEPGMPLPLATSAKSQMRAEQQRLYAAVRNQAASGVTSYPVSTGWSYSA